MYGRVNGILSRCHNDASAATIQRLQSNYATLSASVGSISKKLNDSAATQEQHAVIKTYAETIKTPHAVPKPKTSAIKQSNQTGPDISLVVSACTTTMAQDSSVQSKNSESSEIQNNQTECAEIDRSNNNAIQPVSVKSNASRSLMESKLNCPPKTGQINGTSDQVEINATLESERSARERFTAVRRKKNITYFVGNIDTDVTELDLYDYLKSCKVHVTNITMYHSRYGSSARINIPYTESVIVEADNFWPADITFRKWLNRSEWQKQYGRERRDMWESQRTDTYTRDRHRNFTPAQNKYGQYDDKYDDTNYTTEKSKYRRTADMTRDHTDYNASRSTWNERDSRDDWDNNIDEWRTNEY